MAIQVVYKTGLQGPQGPAGAGTLLTFDWFPADGYVKTVTHNLNTVNLSYSFIDLADGTTFEVGEIQSLSSNVVQFTVDELPTLAGWRILIRQ